MDDQLNVQEALRCIPIDFLFVYFQFCPDRLMSLFDVDDSFCSLLSGSSYFELAYCCKQVASSIKPRDGWFN
mgnify:FL=1